jgi:hypothetical protein
MIDKDDKPSSSAAGIRRMKERFDALSERIAKAYAGVPVEEGLAEIDSAVVKVRKK